MNNYFDITKIAQNVNEPAAPAPAPQPIAQPEPIAPPEIAAPIEQNPAQPPAVQPPAQPPVAKPQRGGNRPLLFVKEAPFGSWMSIVIQAPSMTKDEFSSLQSLAKVYIQSVKKPNGTYPTWATWVNKAKKNALQIADFKLFSKTKDMEGPFFNIGTTEAPFFTQILDKLSEMGFDTAQIQRYEKKADPVAPVEQQQQQQQPVEQKNKVQVSKPEGWQTLIVKFERNNDIRNFIVNNKIGGRWDPAYVAWRFDLRGDPPILPSRLESMSEFMRQKGFDTAELDAAIKEYKDELEKNKENLKDPLKTLIVQDATRNTKFLVSINFPRTPQLIQEMEDYVKFSFPSKGDLTDLRLDPAPENYHAKVPKQLPNGRWEPSGMRLDQQNKWYVYGSFDDFFRFGALIKSRGWDVTNLRAVLSGLLRSKALERTRYSGELDGYEVKDENGRQLRDAKGNPQFDYERFYKDVEEITGERAKLFDKQKDGVRWLYERGNAILGDKTGTGKTLTTLVAAAMRLKQSGGRCLIITLKSTQIQWANEIQNKLGEDPANISYNPGDNKKWTIITYPNISAAPEKNNAGVILQPNGSPVLKPRWRSKQQIIDGIFNTQFTALILDEAHLIKNETSGASQIMALIAPRIPFKWGASATSAANTAIDVHNILSVVGHTLGEISTRDFNKEFVGRKSTIRDFADPIKAREILALQEEKAYNLRKWLTLSGAYLSRSQKAINPNLPEHVIDEQYISEEDFDIRAFARDFENIKAQYGGNAGAALAVLTKQRVLLAQMKVPHTMALAKEILDRGEKVLVFSNFRTCCQSLYAGLDAHLKAQDPDFEVVRIMGDDNGAAIMNAVAQFKDPENPARAMVIAAKKGGTGVSLENSTQNVIMNDFDWSPYIAEQTEGRAFRITNVMPVNTKYMVVKGPDGRLSPDEVFYKFVRSKIKIAQIIQNLDSEAEEYILNGLNDAKIQAEIAKARAADMEADVQLGKDLNEMFAEQGIEFGGKDNDFGQIAIDFNNAVIEREVEGADDEENPRQASTWYDRTILTGSV